MADPQPMLLFGRVLLAQAQHFATLQRWIVKSGCFYLGDINV
jgi:hypothetical protein